MSYPTESERPCTLRQPLPPTTTIKWQY